MKEYEYINDIGEPKKIVIYDKKQDVYPVVLWSMRTGDYCGSGDFTEEQLQNFLEHYHINTQGE